MAVISFYLDTRRAKKDGTFPVKLYVNHHKKFYVKTTFSAAEENWEGCQFSKYEPNYKAKNMAIRALLNRAEEVIFGLEREGRLKSISDEKLKTLIEDAVMERETTGKTLLACFDEFISTKTKQNTIDTYTGTKAKIEAYAGDLSFESINRKWLTDFDNYLAREGLKTNSRSIHLRNLRAVFNYAIDEEVTTNYPFRKFSIPKEETRKRSLSVEQLRLLRDYPCEEYQRKYRDMFLLMFYLIGINAVDLFSARSLRDGRLEYRRAKTNKLYSIKVEPEAMELIERYKGKNFLLDVAERHRNYKDFLHQMGDGLKRIGTSERVGRGGKKLVTPLFPDLSSYWARHTWATLAAELDIPKETISAALGHEIGSPTTSIYIRFDQRKVDEANRRVIDYVNGKKS